MKKLKEYKRFCYLGFAAATIALFFPLLWFHFYCQTYVGFPVNVGQIEFQYIYAFFYFVYFVYAGIIPLLLKGYEYKVKKGAFRFINLFDNWAADISLLVVMCLYTSQAASLIP